MCVCVCLDLFMDGGSSDCRTRHFGVAPLKMQRVVFSTTYHRRVVCHRRHDDRLQLSFLLHIRHNIRTKLDTGHQQYARLRLIQPVRPFLDAAVVLD
jgi:hypothetical protein